MVPEYRLGHARVAGEPDEVWQAVHDQYRPASTTDELPRGRVGMVIALADRIDLTHVPDRIDPDGPEVVCFPPIDPGLWQAGLKVPHPGDPRLSHQVLKRRAPAT